MENRLDLSCLHGKTVILPGVHDKEGRPIISITIPSETPPLDIVRPLHYLLSIFRYVLKILLYIIHVLKLVFA